MATRHELEIEISAEGKVTVTVRGAKGRRCLDYVELLGSIGRLEDQQLTGEFYEPESEVSVADQNQTRTRF